MVTPENALPGREEPVLRMPFFHRVFGTPIEPVPAGSEVAYLALGCFWGAEKLYWQTEGVTSTSVGYAGGFTPNPTYEEACSGMTGHAETVRVAFDPARIDYAGLLKIFFENHDPTQGLRQGNDIGSQYRSMVLTASDEQARVAADVRDRFQAEFTRRGFGTITTELTPVGDWYFAEDYHQQYLDANPHGYCPIHATGVTCS